jgi:hypothetical protein
MKDLEKYIKDGITITKIDGGYRVFTIPTQHFEVKSLDDLVPAAFEEAIKRQGEYEDLHNEMLHAAFERLSAKEIIEILEKNTNETEFAHYYDDYCENKLDELLGPSEEVYNDYDDGDKRVVRFFKQHGVYIMVEGWEMSSYDYEFDSGFIEVIPDHKIKKTFKLKPKEGEKDDLPF